MDDLKRILEEKKMNCKEKRPKYGMRKLSVGLVSCVLGYAIFMSPTIVKAEVIDKDTRETIETKIDSISSKLTIDEILKATSKIREKNGKNKEVATDLKEEAAESEKEKKASSDLPVNETVLLAVPEAKPMADEKLASTKPDEKLVQPSENSENTAQPVAEEGENAREPETTPSETSEENVKPKEKQEEKDSENKEESKGKLAEDEAMIKNHNEKERYRTSEMEAGNGVVKSLTNEEKGGMKEGFKYDTINPKASDTDKKTYGIEIEVDKEKGKRTYTYIGITDSKNPAPSNDGEKDAIESGEKLIKDPTTYKSEAKLKIEGSGADIVLTEEDLKHINSKDNNKTIVAWKDKYKKKQTNTNKQYFNGDNFHVDFAVNPYPNENDALAIMKVETENQSHEKYFVKGQLIRTGAYISNVLKGDQTRIAGEVYHPDGTVLEDAKAFIITDENIEEYKTKLGVDDLKVGEILFNMPEGALDDENSVFNTDKFRGIQNLKVKMYARPRTGDEFKAALPTYNEEEGVGKKIPGKKDVIGEDGEVEEDAPTYLVNGKYTGPVDGTEEITYNGVKVTIDKQGIDRYDHYNLLGEMTINLDDTRDHDQVFDTKVDKPTDKMTKVKPDKPVEININDDFTKEKDNPRETSEAMNELKKEGKAKGELDADFLAKAKAEGWDIELVKDDISKFTVKAPKTAKAGDFIAIPITYTYTNGSNDTHWFHFVVQDTDNNKPEYYAPVGLPGESLTSTPELKENPKKYAPQGYELDGTEFKDDKGNVWKNVKVDPKTGVVTADVPNEKIQGGERLFVPVKVKYTDPKTNETKFEYVKAEFVAKPKYQTEVTTSVEKDIPFETEEKIDENLPAGEIVVDEPGEVGKATVNFKQVVVNGKKGIIDENGKFVEGNDKFVKEEKVTKEKKNRKVRVGVKPVEEKVVIPHTTEYEFDDSIESGKEEIVENGEDGEVTIKTSKDPKTGKVTVTQTKTKEAKPKKIRRGTMVTGEVSHEEKQEVPFEVEIIEDENLEPGKSEIIQAGVAGSKTIKYTQKTKNGKADGEVKKEELKDKEVAPTKQIIKVGKKKTENQKNVKSNVPVEISYVYDNTLDVTVAKTGEVKPGKVETIVTNEYNPTTGKIETVEKTVITPAKQKIIIGTKRFTGELEHKLKETIPFETKIEFDDTLKAGEQKISEAGENGEKTKTVKQEFKDGKEVGNIVSDEKITKEKKDRVIKVGTKTNGTIEKMVEIGFATKIVYDDNLPAGESKVEKEGKNGKKKLTINVVNSKQDGEIKEEIVEVVQDRIIKIGTMCKAPTPEVKPEPKPEDKPEVKPEPKPEEKPNTGKEDSKENKPNDGGKSEESTKKTDTEDKSKDLIKNEDPNKEIKNNNGSGSKESAKSEEKKSEDKSKKGDVVSHEKTNDSTKEDLKSDDKNADVSNSDNKVEDKNADVSNSDDNKAEDNNADVSNSDNSNAEISEKDSVAPKTFDAGVAGYALTGSLASMVVAIMESKKRRKNK